MADEYRAVPLFDALDDVVAGVGGIVNLSKDSRISPALLRETFPGYETFRERLDRYDPKRRMDSALRRRIDV